MNAYRNEIQAAFSRLALKHDLVIDDDVQNYFIIRGKNILLKARWEVERINGIFITLVHRQRTQEVGLYYIVSFKSGTEEELNASRSNKIESIVPLVTKYALPYVLDLWEDFDDLEAFVQSEVSKSLK